MRDFGMSVEAASVRRLVLHWPRLGPYHLARLRGTHELFSARGVIVTALEIAANGDGAVAARNRAITESGRCRLLPNCFRAFSL